MVKIKLPFIKENYIPNDVKFIGLYDKSGNFITTIDISALKTSTNECIYKFGVLSDVHHHSGTNEAQYDYDFQNALQYFNNDEKINYICICGDISEYGNEQEFKEYKQNVSTYSPNTPVYTCTGNHDAQGNGLNDSVWKKYTQTDKNFYIEHENGDVFIFFSINSWNANMANAFTETQLKWLLDTLNTFRNNRCFIFTHLFFANYAGNFKRAYPPGNWLKGLDEEYLLLFIKHFKNTVWFSGHSHWKWHLQEFEDNANIDRYYGDGEYGGWTVHIPSCASPIDSKYLGEGQGSNGSGWERINYGDICKKASEGAIVEVYPDYINVRGIIFKTGEISAVFPNPETHYINKYFPSSQYKLNTTLVNVTELDPSIVFPSDYPEFDLLNYIGKRHCIDNLSKNDGDGFVENNITEENDYLIIKFTSKSQGFFIKGDNADVASTVNLLVEYAAISYDGGKTYTTDNLPLYIGFWAGYTLSNGTEYTLESGKSLIQLDSENRVQLNTSSKFNLDFNQIPEVYLKLKFKLAYK